MLNQWTHTKTSFYLEKGTYRNYCVVYDKKTQKELFRSGMCENRVLAAFQLNNFLKDHPLVINEVLN